MYFTGCCTDLPREAVGPDGFNRFSSGVRNRISKETYSHLSFSRGKDPDPCTPYLDSSMHFLIMSNSTYFTGGAIILTDVGYYP